MRSTASSPKLRRSAARNPDLRRPEEALPPRDVSAEDLEAIFWILAEHGIEVEDGEA